jgi:hypothetical protein
MKQDTLERLFNQRQSGFQNPLYITGVCFYIDIGSTTFKAVMPFSIPDKFDQYPDYPDLPGLSITGANAPPTSELIFNSASNDRAVDKLILDLAYNSDAYDLCRYQYPKKIEWFFKPSWHGAHTKSDMRLNDNTISNNGLRPSGSHGLFPHRFYDDFSDADCYQHIYEFCGNALIKKEPQPCAA